MRLEHDIDIFHRKIRFQSPVADGAQHLAPHVMTGEERLAIERVVAAAQLIVEGTRMMQLSGTGRPHWVPVLPGEDAQAMLVEFPLVTWEGV